MLRESKRRWAISLVFVVLLGGIAGGVSPASNSTSGTEFAGAQQDGVEVSSCATINQPGTYILTDDIVDSTNDACLTIETGNVTIEGGGNSIDGSTQSGQGIIAQHVDNITIRNVEVTDWETGVYLHNVGSATVSGVQANSNVDGLYLSDSENASIRDVTATENSQYGVFNFRSVNSEFAAITASGNERGIMAYGENNTYADLTLTQNGYGLWLSSDGDDIVDSNISNNGEYGIYLSDSTTNTLSDTTLAANGEDVYLFRSRLSASNVRLGDTSMTFEARNAVIDESVADSEPPEGLVDLGKRVSVRAPFSDTSSYLSLNVSYDEEESSGVDESTLRFWRFADGWEQVLGTNNVNPEANIVNANLTGLSTEASTYAVLGEPGAEQTTTTEVEPTTTTEIEQTTTTELQQTTTTEVEPTTTTETEPTTEESTTTQLDQGQQVTTVDPSTEQEELPDVAELSEGEAVRGEVNNPEQVNFYSIDVTAGSTINVDFLRTSGTGSLGVYLYNPDGQFISGIIPAGEQGETARLTRQADRTGTYLISVQSVANGTGGYTLAASLDNGSSESVGEPFWTVRSTQVGLSKSSPGDGGSSTGLTDNPENRGLRLANVNRNSLR